MLDTEQLEPSSIKRWLSITPAKRRNILWHAVGYQPNRAQRPIHASKAWCRIVSGGEGSGKSYVTAMDYVGMFPQMRLSLIVAPKYQAAFPEFDYITEAFVQMGLATKDQVSRPKEGSAHLATVDGCELLTISSEEGTKSITGTGLSPDLIMMVEAGKQTLDVFYACVGRVNRRNGLLVASGTIEKAQPWFVELIRRGQIENDEGIQSFILPTWTNTALYPGGRRNKKIRQLEAIYPADLFNERFGGVPCPPSNLVFREFDPEIHVGRAPYWTGDPAWTHCPVQVWVDPGYDGAYAVLAVQVQGGIAWIIDEVYVQYGFASDVIVTCKQRPWWKLVKTGVIDVAGRQHQGQRSHIEIWRDEAHLYLSSRYLLVDDGVQRHRTFLRNPLDSAARLFHDPRARQTILEYGKYMRHEVTGTIIDRNNHAMKAIAYGLVHNFGLSDPVMYALPRPLLPNQFAWVYGRRG